MLIDKRHMRVISMKKYIFLLQLLIGQRNLIQIQVIHFLEYARQFCIGDRINVYIQHKSFFLRGYPAGEFADNG